MQTNITTSTKMFIATLEKLKVKRMEKDKL